jgi:very-short-patch-repair endonuclease
MRKHTPGEKTMKRMLTELGYKFHQQHILPSPKSFYLLDFYISDSCNVAIEVNGEHHNYNPAQVGWDKMRDAYLASIGIVTIRIMNRALTPSEYDATKRYLKRRLDRLRFKQTRL